MVIDLTDAESDLVTHSIPAIPDVEFIKEEEGTKIVEKEVGEGMGVGTRDVEGIEGGWDGANEIQLGGFEQALLGKLILLLGINDASGLAALLGEAFSFNCSPLFHSPLFHSPLFHSPLFHSPLV